MGNGYTQKRFDEKQTWQLSLKLIELTERMSTNESPIVYVDPEIYDQDDPNGDHGLIDDLLPDGTHFNNYDRLYKAISDALTRLKIVTEIP